MTILQKYGYQYVQTSLHRTTKVFHSNFNRSFYKEFSFIFNLVVVLIYKVQTEINI